MKTIDRLFKGLILLLLVVLGTGAYGGSAAAAPKTGKQKAPELLNIPLLWKPTVSLRVKGEIDLSVFLNKTIAIKPFIDLRTKPSEIGKNTGKKKSGKALLVTTSDDVAAWLTERFGLILQEFEVATVKEGGALTLEADIVRFYVTETTAYTADIGLKMRARSKTGEVIWEGVIAVGNRNQGGPYKAEHYYEALSNTCVDAVKALLKSDAFIEAVRKNI